MQQLPETLITLADELTQQLLIAMQHVQVTVALLRHEHHALTVAGVSAELTLMQQYLDGALHADDSGVNLADLCLHNASELERRSPSHGLG